MEERARLTTSYISLPKKIVLLTYESESEGQHFYDCSFKIPIDIPPGPSGLYYVVINEALFNASYPILENGDMLLIQTNKAQYAINVNNNIYRLDPSELISLLNSGLGETPFEFVFPSGTNINGFQLQFKDVDDKVPFTVSYTANFGYVFNDLRESIASNGDPIFWPLIRLVGPYTFILNTNLIPEVPTINEMGQTFNMSLLTYNTLPELGAIAQMAGTMRCITSNITNIRFQLVNDQDRLIKLKSPIYLQLTIGPYMPPETNSEYYQT